MGVLFPPPDEPLASGFGELKDAVGDLKDAAPKAVGMALVGITSLDLCPLSTPVADPPYENHTPVQYRVQALSVNSTSGQIPFFGSTGDDSANVAIRAGHARRNAQTRVAQMMYSTTAALLMNDDDGSTLDWLPTSSSSLAR